MGKIVVVRFSFFVGYISFTCTVHFVRFSLPQHLLCSKWFSFGSKFHTYVFCLSKTLWFLHGVYIYEPCDFQQCGFWTSVDSDEPVQLLFKLRKTPNAVQSVA